MCQEEIGLICMSQPLQVLTDTPVQQRHLLRDRQAAGRCRNNTSPLSCTLSLQVTALPADVKYETVEMNRGHLKALLMSSVMQHQRSELIL